MLVLSLLAALGAAPSPARTDVARPSFRPAERCEPAPKGGAADAVALLDRALEKAGALWSAGSALHYQAADVERHDYESDRQYAPYLAYVYQRDVWVNPAAGTERIETRVTGPGSGPMSFPTTIAGERATFVTRDTLVAPAAPLQGQTDALRPLNPWLVLRDWRLSSDVRVAGRCRWRDYWRTTLERTGPEGKERLFLETGSLLPVGYERTERHYLWGEMDVEYVYSTWIRTAGVRLPAGSARLEDGEVRLSRTWGDVAMAPLDSAPRLALPDTTRDMRGTVAGFLAPTPPDTVRVGEDAYLLVNRGYTNAVVLAADTVWVLDAQQGEERARQDSLWIGRLFPGRHPVAVVVTDVAWPHVAGVRYWVANGATIVTHPLSRPFLERVIARRWTRHPDLLERRRQRAKPAFRLVSGSAALAGGRVAVHAIDGVASEGALMVWLPRARFLWAGDYVQTVASPSEYAAEVVEAARRAKLAPERVAAQHLRPTDWQAVVAAQED